MKEGKIFLVGNHGGKLIPMVETGYVTEDVLQTLLAQYPDLLAGGQIDPEEPRRWLLVAREMGVPGAENETARWSLDHLFLDQDGKPTFVECKRVTDTRGRREVVAQMLDYAANGVAYWGMDKLRQAASETAAAQGKLLDDEIRFLLDADEEADIEAYWTTVESNLKHGRVRLIFVADETPAELRRLVEFLNEKMQDVEVLAVEIKQYLGQEHKALVPRVVGATEAARRQKSGSPPRNLTRAHFLSGLPSGLVGVFEKILDKAAQRGFVVKWRRTLFVIRVFLDGEKRPRSFLYGLPDGRLQFYFDYLPLDPEQERVLREELLAFGLFRPEGDKTLTAAFDATDIDGVLEMYEFVLHRMQDMQGDFSLLE